MKVGLKRISYVCALLVQFAGFGYPQSVNLAWDPVATPTLAGYNVYRSTRSGSYNGSPLNGASLLRTTSFQDASVRNKFTYYYVVTAVSTTGTESIFSNEV